MKHFKSNLVVGLLSALISQSLFAKTICTMTFNSDNEKKTFQSVLAPLGHQFVELVPDNKDPLWLQKSCAQVQACDSVLISGHFGGLFFGEQRSTTLALEEMLQYKKQGICPALFEKPKSVFLMGCNTLSGKTPDHRSVTDYLHVLVGDGFPMDSAESVAAARYLSFGRSMSEQMSFIFNKAENIIGFESTGPLGAKAAPLLKAAFDKTSTDTKKTDLISMSALQKAFSQTNLRIIKPDLTDNDLLNRALSDSAQESIQAWKTILSDKKINSLFDFILVWKDQAHLKTVIQQDAVSQKNIIKYFEDIYKKSTGLVAIQRKINQFYLENNLINMEQYLKRQTAIIDVILDQDLDYVRADQLCQLLKAEQNTDVFYRMSPHSIGKISDSPYADVLISCAGRNSVTTSKSPAYQCLINKSNHDWGCLTSNETRLDIESCQLAQSRNPDPENADDMMWFCYDKLRTNKKLNSASCLQLTQSFKLFGNQIKMNWNCQNRIN